MKPPAVVLSPLIFLITLNAAPAQRVSGLSAEQAHREKLREVRLQEGAQAMVNMPSVAPLFIEDARFSSTLYIVNEGNPAAVGRLLLLTQDGRIIADKTVTVPGHDKAELAIKPLLEAAKSNATRGSIELFDDNVEGSALAGELVITFQGASASTNLDEELLMPAMSKSHELRGLAIRAVADPVVSLTSTSDQPVQVNVSCTGERSKPTQASFQILSHQTVTIRPCSNSIGPVDASNALDYSATEFGPPEAKGIQILSPDPKAEIQAFGLSPIMIEGEVSYLPIAFHNPDDSISNQAVYPGVPVGYGGELWGTYRPRLVAQNYSAMARTIAVYNARTVPGSSSSFGIQGKLQLQPHSVMTMDIDPGGNAADAMNSYVVEYDGQPDDVQIQLWSEDVKRKSPILFAGKDAKDDRNAGMHPWSAMDGSQDDLILYNETEADQPVNLKISNRQTIWTKTLTLAAHETRRVSPRQLADTQETDDAKNPFSLGAGEGEISWYTYESGNVRGRLQHVDTQSRHISSFQCAGYVVFCGIAPISGPSTVAVSQSATFSSGNPQACVNNEAPQLCYGVQNGSWNSVTWQWMYYSPDFTANGSTSGPSISLTGSQPGSANFEVEAIPYSSDCDIVAYDTVQVTAPDNTPIVTGIDPSVWLAGKSQSVTFTGQYFGTNRPTLGFSPSAGIGYILSSYNDAQIVATVNVAPGTPTEDVTVTVTNNGYGGNAFNGQSSGNSPTSSPGTVTVQAEPTAPSLVVAYSAYIPVDHISGPSGCVYRTTPVQYIYKGDGGYGSYRATETAEFNAATLAVSDFFPMTGQTRQYAYGSPANGATLSYLDEDGIPNDCHLWNQSGQAPYSNFSHVPLNEGTNLGALQFSGSASNPLQTTWAAISWNMITTINVSNPAAPTASVTYNHTCYPAHQVKVGPNNTVVYSYTPPYNNLAYLAYCLAKPITPLSMVSGTTSPISIPAQ